MALTFAARVRPADEMDLSDERRRKSDNHHLRPRDRAGQPACAASTLDNHRHQSFAAGLLASANGFCLEQPAHPGRLGLVLHRLRGSDAVEIGVGSKHPVPSGGVAPEGAVGLHQQTP